jgi:hypothetical protein
MTKLVIFGCSHSLHENIKMPAGDVLICTGDFLNGNEEYELIVFLKWLESQPFDNKILIAGNHDSFFQLWPGLAKQLIKDFAPSVNYLEDSGCEIKGIKFWGAPWTPTFKNWFHMRDRGADIKRHWDFIPDDTDVLITHGPAWHILDEAEDGSKVGCYDLKNALYRVRPKLFCHSHVHYSYGTKDLVYSDNTKTICINASLLGKENKEIRAPFIIDI